MYNLENGEFSEKDLLFMAFSVLHPSVVISRCVQSLLFNRRFWIVNSILGYIMK